ncbi:hypothetical protein TIFTF001_001413 [Ficus carica]|uniref:Uncharacterized protein n=1 Tax=Ficus carica TaxID=3494 RepID=A0AA88CQ76_FICCA|nr:hypothetical protein TIFTF001_001413 [Ficus carica]
MAEEIDEMAKILWPRMDRKIGKLFEIYEEAKMGVDTKATVLITPEKVAAFVEASENLIERYQKTLLEVKRLTLYIAAEILPSPRANEMASLRRDLFICVLCKKIVGRHVEYLRHDETDVYFLGRLSEEIGKGKECSCEHAFDVENGNVVYKIEIGTRSSSPWPCSGTNRPPLLHLGLVDVRQALPAVQIDLLLGVTLLTWISNVFGN